MQFTIPKTVFNYLDLNYADTTLTTGTNLVQSIQSIEAGYSNASKATLDQFIISSARDEIAQMIARLVDKVFVNSFQVYLLVCITFFGTC